MENDLDFSRKATIDTKKVSPVSEEEVAKIAASLGLTEGPIAANDVAEGKVIIYRNEGASLVAYLQKGKTAYSLNELPRGTRGTLAEEEVVALAQSLFF